MKSFLLLTLFKVSMLMFILTVSEACSLYRSCDEIQLIWPSYGFLLSGLDMPEYWDITWLASDGSVNRQRVSGEAYPRITVPREIPLIVSASPVMDESNPFQFRPAGCAVSADTPRSPEITLSWEQGFSASFFLKLAESGVNPDAVNIRKFTDTVHNRCDGRPWTLDLRKINSELLEGRVWVYSFRLLPFSEVSFPLPAGYWYGEYPPDPGIVSFSGYWSGKLPAGLHHFIRKTDRRVLSVWVDERGEVITYSDN